jgi:hypothetical protein
MMLETPQKLLNYGENEDPQPSTNQPTDPVSEESDASH